jgi:hypothetical protein
MKATKQDYSLFLEAFKKAQLPQKPSEMSETRYIWDSIWYTGILSDNRHLYENLNDDNIQAVAKKALKELGLM